MSNLALKHLLLNVSCVSHMLYGQLQMEIPVCFTPNNSFLPANFPIMDSFMEYTTKSYPVKRFSHLNSGSLQVQPDGTSWLLLLAWSFCFAARSQKIPIKHNE